MPPPKRTDLDDYYVQLAAAAVPHLTKLRALCQQGLPKAKKRCTGAIRRLCRTGRG